MNEASRTAQEDAPDDMATTAIRGALWSAAETWGARLVTTGVFIILARRLDPEAFGLVALALVFVELGNRLVHQGFGASIVQRREIDDAHIDTAFWLSVGSAVVFGGLTVAGAGLVEQLLHTPGLQPVLQVLALRFLFDALSSAQQSILQRELRFRALAVRRLVSTVAGGVVGVALALGDAGVWSLVGQIMVQQLVGVVILWSAANWRPTFRFSRSHLSEMFGFSAGVSGIAILRFFQREGENLIIAAALNATALGFYSVAKRFPRLLNDTFTRSIGRVTFPVLSRLQADPERSLRGLHRAARTTSFFAGPAFISLAVFAPQILTVLVGERWLPAVPVMRLVAILNFVNVQTTFMSDLVMASGRIGGLVRLRFALTVTKLAAVAVAAPHGLTAVAWAVFGASLVGMAANASLAARISGISVVRFVRPQLGPVVAMLIATVPMVAVATAAPGDDITTLAAGLAVGGVTYLAAAWLVARQTIRETVDMVQRALRRSGAPG